MLSPGDEPYERHNNPMDSPTPAPRAHLRSAAHRTARTCNAKPTGGSHASCPACEEQRQTYISSSPSDSPPATTSPSPEMADYPLLPTNEAARLEILDFMTKYMPPDGAMNAWCYDHATELPPITKESLAELDVQRIANNPKLRHDVNFDRELHFRPNLEGLKGQQKRQAAEEFWRALEGEIIIYNITITRRDGAEDAGAASYWHRVMKASQKRLPGIFSTVSEVLQTLVPEADKEMVADRLDKDLIIQQIERSVCNYVDLAKWLGLILKSHCAPMRDVEVDKMESIIKQAALNLEADNMVLGMRKLLDILETMKLDVANHQIRRMHPLLVGDTINFQRLYHTHRIELGKFDPIAPRVWLRDAMGRLEADGRSAPALEALTFRLVNDIVFEPTSFVPDAFYLDADRIKILRTDVHHQVFHRICRDLFLATARPQGPLTGQQQTKLRDAFTTLRKSIDNLVGSSGRFCELVEFVAVEIGRVALRYQGRSPRFDQVATIHDRLVEQLNPRSAAFVRHGNALIRRLLPKLHRSVSEHLRLSATDLQEVLVPYQPIPMDTSDAFGAIMAPASEPKFEDEDLSIVNRLTHIIVLHWQVWSDLVYLSPARADSDSDDSSSNGDDFNGTTSAAPSPSLPPATDMFSEHGQCAAEDLTLNEGSS